MEKFMLIFQGIKSTQEPSAQQMQDIMAKWMAWIDKLAKQGRYESGEPLLPGGKLVKGTNGSHVTDGPYTEGKEIVGGYFIINAKDMNEAVEIAKDCPDFDYGGEVQVRQVMKM